MTLIGRGEPKGEITTLIDFSNFELIVIKALALLAVLFYSSQVYMNDIKCRVRFKIVSYRPRNNNLEVSNVHPANKEAQKLSASRFHQRFASPFPHDQRIFLIQTFCAQKGFCCLKVNINLLDCFSLKTVTLLLFATAVRPL